MKIQINNHFNLQKYRQILILNLKFLIVLICLSSCKGFSDIKIGEIKNMEIKGFEENSFVFSVKLNVNNPTNHKITVTNIDAKVYLNNQYIGKLLSSEKIIFSAKKADDYTIRLKVRLSNILGTAFTMMQLNEGNRVNFRIEGVVSARSFIILKKIPVSESRDIKI
jgi:LEA14-like dessication related protein